MDFMPMAYVAQTESLLLLGLVGTIFWIAMLVDVLRRQFRDSTMKLIWVVVIALTHFPGALIYFFLGRSMGRQNS